MIERVSRYYDGPLLQTKNKYTTDYVISVFRSFPQSDVVNYISHIWQEGDTLAGLAETYGTGAKYWWEIMDVNPEIIDPFGIEPGTVIKVPYGK